MAAHWLVTGALLADLYRKYCNDRSTSECNETDRRFTALTVMSFVCAGGWVSDTYVYSFIMCIYVTYCMTDAVVVNYGCYLVRS